jgi:hypothetical protein
MAERGPRTGAANIAQQKTRHIIVFRANKQLNIFSMGKALLTIGCQPAGLYEINYLAPSGWLTEK